MCIRDSTTAERHGVEREPVPADVARDAEIRPAGEGGGDREAGDVVPGDPALGRQAAGGGVGGGAEGLALINI